MTDINFYKLQVDSYKREARNKKVERVKNSIKWVLFVIFIFFVVFTIAGSLLGYIHIPNKCHMDKVGDAFCWPDF